MELAVRRAIRLARRSAEGQRGARNERAQGVVIRARCKSRVRMGSSGSGRECCDTHTQDNCMYSSFLFFLNLIVERERGDC